MTPHLRAAARAIRRRATIPLLGLLVGVLGALLVTAFLPRTYESAASMLVVAETPHSGDAPAPGFLPTDLVMAQNLLPTVTRLAESREVARTAAQALGLPVDEVAGHLDGAYEPGLQIITVTATADSPRRAAALANAATQAVGDQLARLRIGGSSPISARPLDTADPPTAPTSPRPLPNGALGALVGLLAGIGGMMLRDRVDDRISGIGRLPADLGLPLIGVFPALPRRYARRDAAELAHRGRIAPALDAAVATLAVLSRSEPCTRILVTSPRGGDREAVVAALLAVGLARAKDVDGYVVTHAPPVLAGADLAAMVRPTDATVLVVQNGVTRAADTERAAALVQRLGGGLAGLIVVNASGEVVRSMPAPPVAAVATRAPAHRGALPAAHAPSTVDNKRKRR